MKTAEIMLYWRNPARYGLGRLYPVARFAPGTFASNHLRSIALDIYEHNASKAASLARAHFLVLADDEIPENLAFDILDGARCIATAIRPGPETLARAQQWLRQ